MDGTSPAEPRLKTWITEADTVFEQHSNATEMSAFIFAAHGDEILADKLLTRGLVLHALAHLSHQFRERRALEDMAA